MYIYFTYSPPIFLSWRKGYIQSLGPHNNIAINLTMAHEHNIAQHHVETPNNYWQLELLIHGMCEGSVVEDAVECNSWGKSRREQMCRFPNTGGLHRTSGGAPLETPTLRDPELITCGGIREGRRRH